MNKEPVKNLAETAAEAGLPAYMLEAAAVLPDDMHSLANAVEERLISCMLWGELSDKQLEACQKIAWHAAEGISILCFSAHIKPPTQVDNSNNKDLHNFFSDITDLVNSEPSFKGYKLDERHTTSQKLEIALWVLEELNPAINRRALENAARHGILAMAHFVEATGGTYLNPGLKSNLRMLILHALNLTAEESV